MYFKITNYGRYNNEINNNNLYNKDLLFFKMSDSIIIATCWQNINHPGDIIISLFRLFHRLHNPMV